jgi:hypothetical protein
VRAQWIIRISRLAILLVFASAIGLAISRFRRTPEQLELTQYIEKEVPSLFSLEQPIDERIERLSRAPGLQPDQARALLVDEIIPRLIQLRRQAEALPLRTEEAKRLNGEYLALTDRLVDACRSCVQVIDDPAVPDGAGLIVVRERFADVRRAYQVWDEHVRVACVRHRLAPPAALPRP